MYLIHQVPVRPLNGYVPARMPLHVLLALPEYVTRDPAVQPFNMPGAIGRLLGHFGGSPPTPSEVLAADPEEMRAAAGLSRAKVSFLRSLAEHVLDGSLELERLDELPDEQVTAELVAVKGLGPWTADMFLLFHLQRPDVMAVGDLGIRRAVMIAYQLEELPDPAKLTELAEPWRPYRSVACRYLWRSLDATPV